MPYKNLEIRLNKKKIAWETPFFSTANLIGIAASALRKRGKSNSFAEDWYLVIGIQSKISCGFQGMETHRC